MSNQQNSSLTTINHTISNTTNKQTWQNRRDNTHMTAQTWRQRQRNTTPVLETPMTRRWPKAEAKANHDYRTRAGHDSPFSLFFLCFSSVRSPQALFVFFCFVLWFFNLLFWREINHAWYFLAFADSSVYAALFICCFRTKLIMFDFLYFCRGLCVCRRRFCFFFFFVWKLCFCVISWKFLT